MLKLMKYEFRKQLLSKFIILITLGVLELVFLYGLFADRSNVLGTSIGLFIFLTFAAMFFVSFECVITFSNDLRTKQSHMLFLTPNTAYKIVGAKVIAAVVQIIATWAAFCVVVVINILVASAKYELLDRILEGLGMMFRGFLNMEINLGHIFLILASIVISWVATVIIAMLSITLSATFLSNVKGKGFLSIVFFFIINWIIYEVQSLLSPSSASMISINSYVFSCIFMACITIVAYVLTAWMLDKKVSV